MLNKDCECSAVEILSDFYLEILGGLFNFGGFALIILVEANCC
jgi:hypothetical protein